MHFCLNFRINIINLSKKYHNEDIKNNNLGKMQLVYNTTKIVYSEFEYLFYYTTYFINLYCY